MHSVIVLAGRKQGISHAYFQQRYENHIQMISRLAGDAMPLRHTRRYLARGNGANDIDIESDPQVLAGKLDYDVIVEMDFGDEAHFGRFVAALAAPEAAKAVEEDEAGFWDRGHQEVVVVGKVQETRRDV